MLLPMHSESPNMIHIYISEGFETVGKFPNTMNMISIMFENKG